MIRRLLAALTVLVLAGCGGPTIPGGQDLGAALVQDGDLPAGWQAGQITDGPGSTLGAATAATVRAARALAGPEGDVGEAGAAVYGSADAVGGDYAAIMPGVTTDGAPLDGVGDQALERGNIVLWRRCNALAYVRLDGVPPSSVQAYARRLDARLKELLTC